MQIGLKGLHALKYKTLMLVLTTQKNALKRV